MRHFVINGVLVVVLAIATYAGLMAIKLMPVEASAQSIPIDWLWNIEMAIISFLFALIVVPMCYSLIVWRRRKGDTSDGEHMEGNTTLEIAWTVIPLILVLVVAYLGAYTLGEVQAADPNALQINVIASQWQWVFEYPQGFASKELHLPVNQQVVLNMQSLDVIHSFWVPEFRIKQDVLPGRTTFYRVTPILPAGTSLPLAYMVRCAELCGTSHARMESPVIVTSRADYDAWVSAQAASAQAALAAGGPEAGKVLVTKYGCGGCHSVDGSRGVGPTWQGLYQAQVRLSDGTTIKADQPYILESIVKPSAKIVAGYPDGVMPGTFGTVLTPAQISDIVSYIETLK